MRKKKVFFKFGNIEIIIDLGKKVSTGVWGQKFYLNNMKKNLGFDEVQGDCNMWSGLRTSSLDGEFSC